MGVTTISEAAGVKEKDAQHVLGTYGRAPFVLARGSGMTLVDTEGQSYLDFGSGIAVNALGHADPEIMAAMRDQMATLGHTSNLFLTAPQAELASMLCRMSFADKVFFCNSGAEAIEAAIKIARKYARVVHSPGKTGIVAFTGGFHGRTVGSLAITAREKYQAPFRPLMPDVTFAPFNDIEGAARLIGPQTCAVFVEPVQGEGGIHVASPEFLEAVRIFCDRFGTLLVFDEIQSGLGRTGKLWAYQHFGIEPDIMTLAKALGGGLPMGAALMTQQVADVMEVGDHGSTFAGGPVVSKVAQVVLRRTSDPDMLAHVRAMGNLLSDGLCQLKSSHIRGVRSLGLMVGVDMDIEVKPLIEAGYQNGVILLNAGPTVLRLLPPLIVGESEIEQLITVLNRILED